MARLLLALALTFAGAAAGPALAQVELDPREEELPGTDPDPLEDPDAGPRKPPAGSAETHDRPLMLRLGATRTWDSNLFRAPNASSERIGAYSVGVSVDKPYAQQRFRLELTETAYRYDNFSYLDFEGLNYAGSWSWKFTPRIGGALSATREESLADYGEFRQPGVRNVRTTENLLAGADAELFGGWHLTGGLRSEKNRYSVPFAQEGSYRANGGEAGVRWVASSANWLAFNLRSLDGRYVDRALDPAAKLDDGFRRNEAEALLAWRATPKSSFEGRAAWVDYRSDHFPERDFSGLAGRLRYVWSATGNLALQALLARELEPWSDAAASYRVEQRVTAGLVWQPLARTTLRLDASYAENDFRGALPGFAGTPRHDRQNTSNFALEWRALRNLSLQAGAQAYRQSSTDPRARIAGELFTAGISLLF